MRLRTILNLVDDVSPVNYGIWHAAIATSAELWEKYGIQSWLISPFFDPSFDANRFPWLRIFRLDSLDAPAAKKFFAGFNPQETVVATHGCWKYPTRWGRIARTFGFPWVYTPHGMLEPWSMQQKAWKKIPYFHLAEKRYAGRASLVRAVGRPELENLKKYFPTAVHIPNGIYQSELNPLSRGEASFRAGSRNHFLFLARLHFKKNVLPLAEAWVQSSLSGQPGCALRIAGTDDGEQQALEAFIRKNPHAGISFSGPVFGEKKKQALTDSDFYVLPSISEGFPTSVVEAAGAGLVCLISQGCNFPELLQAGAALDSGTSIYSIRQALETALELDAGQRNLMQQKARQLIEANFVWEEIAQQQANRYAALIDAQKV